MNMKIVAIIIAALIFLPSIYAFDEKEVEIKAAIYFSNIERFADEIRIAIDYSWEVNGIKYRIRPEIVNKHDVLNGKLSNFDVFIIPGSGRHYFDALLPEWRRNVREFIASGGGYVGICGGANLASMGFGKGAGINELLGVGALKIANVYVNDEQEEEWQYLWKSNWEYGGIPLRLYIPESEVPIFDGFYGGYINMRYWGGPGMYNATFNEPLLGKVIPLAIYAEEPMEVAPLHYWKWRDGEWYPYMNVTTDIKGQFAAVASNYGEGRIVIFGPHPEKATFFDGYVREFPVRPYMGRFTWFIYEWTGNKSNVSYNWWVLRRSVAWAAGLGKEEMPYASQIAACIEKPGRGIFFDGRKIFDATKYRIYIGDITFDGYGIQCEKLLLYIDNEPFMEGKNRISARISLPRGWHKLRMVAVGGKEEAGDETTILSL